MKKTSNKSFLLILASCLLCTYVYAKETEERAIIFNNYKLEVIEQGGYSNNIIKLYKNGKEVPKISKENFYNFYKEGKEPPKEQELLFTEGRIDIYLFDAKRYINGTEEITEKNPIVEVYTGGAHCCYESYLLDLSDSFKVVAKIYGNHSPVEISKINDNPTFLIKIHDWSYAYKWTSFAGSPSPEVILLFQNGKLELAKDLMKKDRLSEGDIKEKIKQIKSHAFKGFKYYELGDKSIFDSEFASSSPEDDLIAYLDYFGALLPLVLDLLYSGNDDQSLEIIDKTWPGDANSKVIFLSDLKKAIEKSYYGKQLNIKAF